MTKLLLDSYCIAERIIPITYLLIKTSVSLIGLSLYNESRYEHADTSLKMCFICLKRISSIIIRHSLINLKTKKRKKNQNS